jgi:long-chain acyl-CoA synthetase
LPSAHVFEQAAFMMSVVHGMKVGFYSGNVMALTSDLAILKPTFLPAVPRLLNSIYSRIRGKLYSEEGIKKNLIDYGVELK